MSSDSYGLKALQNLPRTVLQKILEGTIIEWSSIGEDIATFPKEVKKRQLIAEEVSGHVDHHLIAGEDEPDHDGGDAAQHVAPVNDNNGYRRKSWHSGNNHN